MSRSLRDRPGRRSARVPLSAHLVITAAEAQYRGLRVESDTINVSLHGARICSNVDLRPDMQVKIFLPWRNRVETGRIVWSRVTSSNEYGIELDSDENFWGIPFSPDRWPNLERYDSSDRRKPVPSAVDLALRTGDPITSESGPSKQSRDGLASPNLAAVAAGVELGVGAPRDAVFHQERDKTLSLLIPASGLPVLVSGLTMSGMPFRENTLLVAEDSDETTAFVWLNSVIRDGARLRIVFPNQLTTTVRVRATLANSSRIEASPVIVEFPDGMFVSREVPGEEDID